MKHETDRFAKLLIRASWMGIMIISCLLLLSSCQKPFDVNVKAEEPIKVDLSMDVHVYNHGTNGSASAIKKTSPTDTDPDAEQYRKTLESRRNRMDEVQKMKNARYVGENHLGLLELQNLPEEESAAEWVKKTLKDENDDRKFLMDHEVETRGKTLREVQAEQRRHWLEKSHPGEWIEIDNPETPGSYIWIQKESRKEE